MESPADPHYLKDLCKPCSSDSECSNGTVCSTPRLFPDSPIDPYCIPKDAPHYSCLKSSQAYDFSQRTVGVPGIDTPHYLMPSHVEDYLTCASECFTPSDKKKEYYPVSIFLKKQPTDGDLKKQTDLFGLSAQGNNCLCLAMADPSVMDTDQLPNLLAGGDRGNCAAILGDTDSLALTINMSQGPWGKSHFYSPDFLTHPQLCTPPDKYNTGTIPDLCIGAQKLSDPFDFVDENGYWWQGTWCCSTKDIRLPNNNFCNNGAIPVAKSDGTDWHGQPAIYIFKLNVLTLSNQAITAAVSVTSMHILERPSKMTKT
jgi:hypothetical protein